MAQKMSHTPGPWTYEETTLSICRSIVSVDDVRAFKVCPEAMESHAIAYVPCDVRRAEQEANARVMTASPELLATLKAMLLLMSSLSEANTEHRLRELAEMAIAKAELS